MNDQLITQIANTMNVSEAYVREELRKIQAEKYVQARLELIRRNSTYGLMKGEETKNE